MAALYPSLIAADQLSLKETIRLVEPYCQGFHCDIMDNHFVPNLTWGPLIVNAITPIATKPLWVHLMVDQPLTIIEKLELMPTSIVSFHIESTVEVEKIINRIKEKKWRASLAISPKTAPEITFAFLPILDQLLVMSVEPGASGQVFKPESLDKIKTFVTKRAQHNHQFTIGVDGGITQSNIASVIAAGGQELVLGTAVFAQNNPIAALTALRKLSA